MANLEVNTQPSVHSKQIYHEDALLELIIILYCKAAATSVVS